MPRVFNLRQIVIALAMFSLVVIAGGSAKAGTITFDPLTGLKGTGFGTRITILSLQVTDNGSESGATTFANPSGTGDSTNQDGVISMLQLSNLGITGIGNFGLIYNLNQTGQNDPINLNSLVVTFYNAAGGTVASFTLTATFNAPPFDSGNGGSGYPAVFSANATESAAIANLIATCPTCVVGASANIGPGANDGADSFFVYNRTAPVPTPEPASMLLLGTGLLGAAGIARRRFRK